MSDLSKGESSFNLDRALDWLELEKRPMPEVREARRFLLKAQARLGFTRNEASPEKLSAMRHPEGTGR